MKMGCSERSRHVMNLCGRIRKVRVCICPQTTQGMGNIAAAIIRAGFVVDGSLANPDGDD